jgi:hypothetical protein
MACMEEVRIAHKILVRNLKAETNLGIGGGLN